MRIRVEAFQHGSETRYQRVTRRTRNKKLLYRMSCPLVRMTFVSKSRMTMRLRVSPHGFWRLVHGTLASLATATTLRKVTTRAVHQPSEDRSHPLLAQLMAVRKPTLRKHYLIQAIDTGSPHRLHQAEGARLLLPEAASPSSRALILFAFACAFVSRTLGRLCLPPDTCTRTDSR
jgi:hypothetical protein